MFEAHLSLAGYLQLYSHTRSGWATRSAGLYELVWETAMLTRSRWTGRHGQGPMRILS
jgi:hypothetical protein